MQKSLKNQRFFEIVLRKWEKNSNYDAATYTFTFETNQFSSYALTYADAADSNNATNAQTTNVGVPTTSPKTGDNTPFAVGFVLLLAEAFLLAFVFTKKNRM